MTVWVLGAYTRDLFMRCDALPRNGESIALHDVRESDGGKGANQAVAASRLGADVRFIGALGTDGPGERGSTVLEKEGIAMNAVMRVPAATGVSFIMTARDAAQTVSTFDEASSLLTEEHVNTALTGVAAGDIVSIQGEIPMGINRSAITTVMGAPEVRVICNPSPIETFLEAPDPWDGIDILVVNELEAQDIAAAAGGSTDTGPGLAHQVRDITQVPTVVMSRGADGAVISEDGLSVEVPTPHVKAVDTTGAGDAFTGALVAELGAGADIVHACRTAVSVGALSVTRPYCIPSYPTRSELDHWMSDTV